MHRTDKYSQHISIIWPAGLYGWVFIFELIGCGSHSHCSHLNFRYHACFGQGVPWHSGKYKVWIHSKTRTWHDKNMQSILCEIDLFHKIAKVPLRLWHQMQIHTNKYQALCRRNESKLRKENFLPVPGSCGAVTLFSDVFRTLSTF